MKKIYSLILVSILILGTSREIFAQGKVNLGDDKNVCHLTILDAGVSGDTYLWSNGATTKTIMVTATGNYSVEVKIGGCKYKDEVLIDVNACLGTEELENTYDLHVFPNPSVDNFNLAFNVPNTNDVVIRIRDITGQVMYLDNLNQYVGPYNKKIDMSFRASGFYFLQLNIGEQQINHKLILNN